MKDRRKSSVQIEGINERGSFKIWVAIFLIALFIALDLLLKQTVEETKRDQARYNLQQIKYCYVRSIEVMTQKMAFETCTNKSKTSYTGDVYILDADTLGFVHETSRDVPRMQPMYFTKDSVGQYFRDWESAAEVIRIVQLGKDSEKGVGASYIFDGDEEWLEWKFLPSEFGGLDGRRLIAVQGTQRDEVLKYWNAYRYLYMVGTSLVVFLLLVENSRRREDECR